MKYLFVSFLSILFLLGCSSINEVPQGILKVNPMADLIFDITLAEGYAETFLLTDSTKVKDSIYQREISKVLQLHNLTSKTFTESYTFYSNNPVLFKIVIDSANARASRNKQKIFTRFQKSGK